MQLAAGTRLGPYEILAPLGAGGMGEVYRGRDVRLDREVAIKVLPAALAQDADRLARFEREAKVLASLNHPNVAQIYGVEDSSGMPALAMELVQGKTLTDPVPLETALDHAAQIADALEAAHEKGIIHRDLKPANVMVTPAGVVKVLDFGLAATAQSNKPASADSPTITFHASQVGMIMGTASYMSPEQAVGKPVDRRTDIWSFGVLLFEMLSGKPLFAGETIPHVLADVIRADVDFSRLPESTPAPIRELVRRCLDRDVRTRLRDIGEARIAIRQYLADPVAVAPKAAPATSRPARSPWILAAGLGVVAMGLAYVAWSNRQVGPAPPVTLSLGALGKKTVDMNDTSALSVSPDGKYVAFRAVIDGQYALWLHNLESGLGKALDRSVSNAARNSVPFWSADSKFLAYSTVQGLRKVDVLGGAEVVICESCFPQGAAWNQDGVIIFGSPGGSVMRVSSAGGAPAPATELIGPAAKIPIVTRASFRTGGIFCTRRESESGPKARFGSEAWIRWTEGNCWMLPATRSTPRPDTSFLPATVLFLRNHSIRRSCSSPAKPRRSRGT